MSIAPDISVVLAMAVLGLLIILAAALVLSARRRAGSRRAQDASGAAHAPEAAPSPPAPAAEAVSPAAAPPAAAESPPIVAPAPTSPFLAIALALPGTPVAAGGSLDGTLTVRNRGDEVDCLRVQLSGIDPAWYGLTPSEVNLFPGDQEQVSITLHPPRSSETRAGRHPVTVVVRSTAHPGEYVTGHIELDILPYFAAAAELRPRRVTAGVGREASCTLVITNRGNAPVGLYLTALDDEAALEFRFAATQITVEPGLSQAVALAVAPRPQWRGQLRSYAFVVTGQPAGGREPVRASGELVVAPEVVAPAPIASAVRPQPASRPVLGILVAFLVLLAGGGGLLAISQGWRLSPAPQPEPTWTSAPMEPTRQSFAPTRIWPYCAQTGESPVFIAEYDPVRVVWTWGASTPEQVQDHLATNHTVVTLDGRPLPGQPEGEIFLRNDTNRYYFSWFADVGTLPPGSHMLTWSVSWNRQISDGQSTYGPGSQHETVSGNCEVIVR